MELLYRTTDQLALSSASGNKKVVQQTTELETLQEKMSEVMNPFLPSPTAPQEGPVLFGGDLDDDENYDACVL